jgi:hypothetical protein
LLAYAQSVSVVRYIQAQYGNQAVRGLVNAFADGADCQSGVQRALGLTLDELKPGLVTQPGTPFPLAQFWQESGLWLLLAAGLVSWLSGFSRSAALAAPARLTAACGKIRRVSKMDNIKVNYDRDADVLYVAFSRSEHVIGIAWSESRWLSHGKQVSDFLSVGLSLVPQVRVNFGRVQPCSTRERLMMRCLCCSRPTNSTQSMWTPVLTWPEPTF